MGKNDTTRTTAPSFTTEVGTTIGPAPEAAAALEGAKAELETAEGAKPADGKPPRSVYKHKPCGSITRMRPALVEAVAKGRPFDEPFCEGCRKTAPAVEFVWCELEGGGVNVTEEPVGGEKSAAPVAAG